PKGGCGSVEYLLHMHRVEQTGCATTQEHCLHRSLARQRLPGAYLCTDRLDVAVIRGRVPGENGEGAIRAALRAERDMHIEAERVRWTAHVSIFSAAKNASCGISTLPSCFMRFLPSFCRLSSLRLRVISPP